MGTKEIIGKLDRYFYDISDAFDCGVLERFIEWEKLYCVGLIDRLKNQLTEEGTINEYITDKLSWENDCLKFLTHFEENIREIAPLFKNLKRNVRNLQKKRSKTAS